MKREKVPQAANLWNLLAFCSTKVREKHQLRCPSTFCSFQKDLGFPRSVPLNQADP